MLTLEARSSQGVFQHHCQQFTAKRQIDNQQTSIHFKALQSQAPRRSDLTAHELLYFHREDHSSRVVTLSYVGQTLFRPTGFLLIFFLLIQVYLVPGSCRHPAMNGSHLPKLVISSLCFWYKLSTALHYHSGSRSTRSFRSFRFVYKSYQKFYWHLNLRGTGNALFSFQSKYSMQYSIMYCRIIGRQGREFWLMKIK